MRAIILIGGFGTRLRPLTLTQPKALLPVLNRPFLSYQLDLLNEGGVNDVMLACGKHLLPWKRKLSALAPRGMKIRFAFEPRPLGTGGAIRYAYDCLNQVLGRDQRPILVFNGDVFFNLSIKGFLRFHQANRSSCTIALTRVDDPSRFGLVDIDRRGQIHRFIEKPKRAVSTDRINAGAYLLETDWIEAMPPGRVISVERESFPQSLKSRKRMFGFTMRGYWNDIGTHRSYLEAHKYLLTTSNRWTAKRFFRKRGDPKSTPPVVIGSDSVIPKSVERKGFLSCGRHVTIGPRARLEESVILDDCQIGEGVEIHKAIIGRACRIGAHSYIRDGAVLGDKTVVPAFSRI